MLTNRSIAALASAALSIGLMQAAVASAQTAPPVRTAAPGVLGVLALDARSLRARRTSKGYTLTGQALVNDACQSARFAPSLLTIFPPQYNLDQLRRPGTMGMMCVQRLTWVTAQPRMVDATHPPAFITVRTQKRTTRVPIR